MGGYAASGAWSQIGARQHFGTLSMKWLSERIAHLDVSYFAPLLRGAVCSQVDCGAKNRGLRELIGGVGQRAVIASHDSCGGLIYRDERGVAIYFPFGVNTKRRSCLIGERRRRAERGSAANYEVPITKDDRKGPKGELAARWFCWEKRQGAVPVDSRLDMCNIIH
jgi:hypothetical protein